MKPHQAALKLVCALAFATGTLFASDVYIGPDGTEYLPGYQPSNARLVHREDIPVTASSPKDVSLRSLRSPSPSIRSEGTGYDFGIYGGISPFQSGDIDISSPILPGASLRGKTQDRTGGVAGGKVGYTWAGFGTSESPSLVQPALYADFFWTGLGYKATDGSFGSGGYLKADLDLTTFHIEPVVKFNLGKLRPYVGFGLGGTYLSADNASVSVPGIGTAKLSGSPDTFCFSAQGLVGTEYLLNPHWALTAEYKYLYVVDPKLEGEGTIPLNYHSDGLGFHMLTAGVKYLF